jgi:hypothetical protein
MRVLPAPDKKACAERMLFLSGASYISASYISASYISASYI